MICQIKDSGLCLGARNAIEIARKHENELQQRQIILFGELVNNDFIMQNFIKNGYVMKENVNVLPENAVVVIRAHGVSQSVYEELKKKNIVIEDSTCVKIKKIHKIVEQKSTEGYKVIIVGKKNHPEVIGIAGWCVPGSAIVVECESDLNGLDLSGKICIVAQTTCNRNVWEEISDKAVKINASCEVYNTLCDVIKVRVDNARELAQSVDTMIVMGDKNSSNSQELYRQCSLKCINTFFISTLSALQEDTSMLDKILHSSNIGLVSGASVSDNAIAEVYNFLVFCDFLKTAKKEIDVYFENYFKENSTYIKDNLFMQDSWKDLSIQNEGGKRIRGALVKLGEMIASKGMCNNYLAAAASYELFQTAILIHDDIIDKSDMRRRKITIHAKSEKEIKDLYDYHILDDDARHYGISKALCIGDYGFFTAYQILAQCPVDAVILSKLYQMFSQIYAITCEGEIMDTLLPYSKNSLIDKHDEYESMILKIYESKTAWYTLAGPLILGAICGGADEKLISLLKDIAIPLGIAFQIKDDLLGIYSNEEILGKPVLSDIRENKQTLLLGVAYRNANKEQRELISQHYGKENASESDLNIVKKVFEETGARQYAEEEIIRLADISRKLIVNVKENYQSILYGLISYLVGRTF